MSTFVLIHGAGDGRLVLAPRGGRACAHAGTTSWLPTCRPMTTRASLSDYADAVVAAVGDRKDLVVVGQSFGGFTAPLVADRLHTDVLVLVAGMVPSPGETPGDWWENTGYRKAVAEQAARDGGKTGNDDPYVSYFHDVPRELAAEALRRERAHPSEASMASPWPLRGLAEGADKVRAGTEDRFFPPDFFRRLVADRLEITPDEIRSGHCVALSRPHELAGLLES